MIEWDFGPAQVVAEIPYGPGFNPGSIIDDPYPFAGNGFTSTRSGRLVPEYRMTADLIPPEGARLYELGQDGTKTLRATFTSGIWVAE